MGQALINFTFITASSLQEAVIRDETMQRFF